MLITVVVFTHASDGRRTTTVAVTGNTGSNGTGSTGGGDGGKSGSGDNGGGYNSHW